ncbi:MAG TPA: hypothetical protein PKK33_08660, partial [Candidatus Cloacimonadota bacterium]|nr:hypothetical protein [Candidatus Cloacimonadota bacterium]
MIKKIYFYVFLTLLSVNLLGTTLMSWDFAGNAGNETTVTAGIIDSNISSTAPSGVISRGAGINAATNGDRFNANLWTTTNNNLADAITNNKYMQFVITPGPSMAMTITSLHMLLQRSSTGPYAFAIRSSVDSYASDLGTFSVSSATTSFEQTVSISTIVTQPSTVTFRIYGYSASGGSGSFGFEGSGADLEIIGNASANYTVPSVTMGSISSITHYGCSAAGNVTSDGGAPITGRGIVVSTTSNPQVGGGGVLQFADVSATTGSFSETVNGLVAGTLYYVNAYAANNAGTSYGTATSFTTDTFPAPVILPASNITNVSFKANWQAVVNAQNYRLDVATQPVFNSGGSTTLINEGFAGGLTPPTGWTFSGITQTYTGSGYYGAAAPALKFDSSNDYVETTTVSNPYSISFWVRSSGTMSNANFTMTEYYSSAWHTVASLTPGGTSPYDLPASGTTKTFLLNSSTTKIRFTFTRDSGLVGLDDVLVLGDYSSNTYVPGYNDLLVSGTSQSVTGLTPNTEYYYRVRAYSNNGDLSPNSNTESVIVVYSGSINPPSNLGATAINSSTINLNWSLNAQSDNVMIAYSPSSTFGTPSGSYSVGSTIAGGGTVVYVGNATAYSHSGLTPSTHYYYRAWSVDVENHYSSYINADATTLSGSSERIKVTYIDVKQGDCILIQRGTHNYLIDGGKQLTDHKLVTYLQSLGVVHLDAIMVSHPDYDHYAELVTLLESGNVTVDNFIKNADTSTAVTWSTLMSDIAAQNIPVQIVNNTSS